jgi:hypothetical protein
LGAWTAGQKVRMNAREPLARVVARSKQLRVDVQHLHGCVTASVARIGPQKCVEPSPMITRLTTRLVLHVVNHVSSLVDPRLERLAGAFDGEKGSPLSFGAEGSVPAPAPSPMSIAAIAA